jgi:hypothetical protein
LVILASSFTIETIYVLIAIELNLMGVAIGLEEVANPLLLFGHQHLLSMEIPVIIAVAAQVAFDIFAYLGCMTCLDIPEDVLESYGCAHHLDGEEAGALGLPEHSWGHDIRRFSIVGDERSGLVVQAFALAGALVEEAYGPCIGQIVVFQF